MSLEKTPLKHPQSITTSDFSSTSKLKGWFDIIKFYLTGKWSNISGVTFHMIQCATLFFQVSSFPVTGWAGHALITITERSAGKWKLFKFWKWSRWISLTATTEESNNTKWELFLVYLKLWQIITRSWHAESGICLVGDFPLNTP